MENLLMQGVKKYVANTERVRALSLIDVHHLRHDTEYSEKLRDNFSQIRTISEENHDLLQNLLEPVFSSERQLKQEEIDALNELKHLLLDGITIQNLDLAIISRTVDRLYRDAKEKKNLAYMIEQLDSQIEACYALTTYSSSILCNPELTKEYVRKGEEAIEHFNILMEKENFSEIPERVSQETVIVNYRYMPALYECIWCDDAVNEKVMTQYKAALAILDDPFYREQLPGYDWVYYEERLLEYLSSLSECKNRRGLTEQQLSEVYQYSETLNRKWHEQPEVYAELISEGELRMFTARNRFLQGKISEQAYKKELLSVYAKRDTENYTVGDVYLNLLLPVEYIEAVQGKRVSAEDANIILRFYRDAISYAHQINNSGEFTWFLHYYLFMLEHFIEVSSDFTFEDMCLESFAALHPPTYVHSRMVARFAAYICSHMIEHHPELFIGAPELDSVEAVLQKKDRIVNRIYHAGLVHDIGKLAMIDTIFIYGRKLTDDEFQVIRSHPTMGYVLAQGTSLDTYKDIILSHHQYYDKKRGGYPRREVQLDQTDKLLSDIIMIADCMDAATDTVGRSYANGKSFQEFQKELEAESGTRYSDTVIQCMKETELQKDLLFLLTKGRENTYQDTYYLLLNVAAKGAKKEEEQDAMEAFREFLKEKTHYETAIQLLYYELETLVPERGVEPLIETITMLSMKLKEFQTSREAEYLFGRLEKTEFEDGVLQQSYEILREEMIKQKRVPNQFYEEFVRVKTTSQKVWELAKKQNDYSIFAPHLKKVIEMTKQYCSYIEPGKDTYSVLLDSYEKGMDLESIERIFHEIKQRIVPLLIKIKEHNSFDPSILDGYYDIESQRKVSRLLLAYIGFDHNAGVLGESVHPFTTRISSGDIRLTNSYRENDAINAMFSAIHEGGHGIFDQSIHPDYYNTELENIPFMGLHESQSRFYENILGRNIAFWKPVYAEIQKLLPKLKEVSLEQFEQAINDVHPSFIRVDADELTYCLHIILRFEMEKAIFMEDVPIEELPALWNAKSQELLGITPLSDAEGILQDMHWSDGSFGYFPSYLLGSVYDGMLLKVVEKELGPVDELLEAGRIREITSWLQEHIHQHGRRYSSREIIETICGKEITADDLLDYFENKYTRLYKM